MTSQNECFVELSSFNDLARFACAFREYPRRVYSQQYDGKRILSSSITLSNTLLVFFSSIPKDGRYVSYQVSSGNEICDVVDSTKDISNYAPIIHAESEISSLPEITKYIPDQFHPIQLKDLGSLARLTYDPEFPDESNLTLFTFETGSSDVIPADITMPIVVDFFSFGIYNDGALTTERISNVIVRPELEESGDNTSTFEGLLEFFMLNPLNMLDSDTYDDRVKPIADDPIFPISLGLIDENASRISYNDLGADGVVTPVSDQQDAPSHSGVVSFDDDAYKIGDNVEVRVDYQDLNTDSDIIDIFTVVNPSLHPNDPARDTAGKENLGLYSTVGFGEFGRLVDVTFDDNRWTSGLTENGGECGTAGSPDDELHFTGFTFVETGIATGLFLGDFDVPMSYCNPVTGLLEATTGTDIGVNYIDYTDAANEIIEVDDSAGIIATTGSVSFDRSLYPIPFGTVDDFFPVQSESDLPVPDGDSIFPVHNTGVISDGDQNIDAISEEISSGDLIIHVRVTDDDFDLAPFGQDQIATGSHGPVQIMMTSGSDTLLLATVGGIAPNNGVITTGPNVVPGITRELGPIIEIAPDAGIFEFELPIRYTDGPDNIQCPTTPDDGYESLNGNSGSLGRFNQAPDNGSYCILSDYILTVEYNDPSDASGQPNTFTDLASFGLETATVSAFRDVGVIGGDTILTLFEPDFNLDSDSAETYDLDLIEWDSESATLTLGDLGGEIDAFDPIPLELRETGDNSGYFQVVFAIPTILQGQQIQNGEQITLEFTDWSPTGASYVGEQSADTSVSISTYDIIIAPGSGVPGCEITNDCFIPSDLTVDVGEQVDWINAGTAAHTVTSGTPGTGANGIFDSGLLTPGSDFSFTFDTPGTYTYFDLVHPWDTGTVTVSAPEGIFCHDMTIDELISSGIYPPGNIFDNRNGILEIASKVQMAMI